MNAQTTQTANASKPSEFRGFRLYHVWSRVWPSPNRRYEGVCWASDDWEAGHAARKEFGSKQGKVYDVSYFKNSAPIRKGA